MYRKEGLWRLLSSKSGGLRTNGREVSPSGLKSKQPDLYGRSTTKQPDLYGRSTTFASLRPCVFAFSSSKQPDLYGRSTTEMTFLGLYFSVKSLEKRSEEHCPGSLVASQYKRIA